MILPLVLLLAAQPAAPAGARAPGNSGKADNGRATPSNPRVEFSRGKNAFDRGEYARTIQILRPLLYPEVRLESEGEIVQTHRMLGIAHLYERQPDAAAQEFRNLLQLRPDYRMDRYLDPPAVVEFFNDILKQQEAELAELERKRQQAEAEEQRRRDAVRNGGQVVERHYVRNSMAVSFIPFGAGQFQNGQPGKGWFFLGTEAALATVSIAAFTTNFALYGARPPIRCQRGADTAKDPGCPQGYVETSARSRSELLLKVQLVSGALFFATAIWGVTDAVLNFQQQVVLTPIIEPAAKKPADGGGGKASAPRRPRGSGPRLGLVLMPDGQDGVSLGGGLTFRF